MSAGTRLRGGDPREAIAAGVAHVPEDRLGTGLAPSLSVTSNVVIKTYRTPLVVARSAARSAAHARDAPLGIIRRYDVKTPGPETPVRNLSGGNLQKLVLGREFADDPLVLIVAQPTRGLDVGAIETVHAYLREAAADGVAVLLISEDLDEIRALADRIVVMYEGEIVGELACGRRVDRGDRAAHGRRDARDEARAPARRSRGGCPSPSRSARSSSRSRSWRSCSRSTGHDPGSTYQEHPRGRRSPGTARCRRRSISATPILFTGLAAAAAFRMQLFNIGAEGQLYLGAHRRVVDRAPARRSRRDVDAALRRRDVRRRRRARERSGR